MTAPVLSLCDARQRRALRLVAAEPSRALADDWSVRPGPDGDVWVRRGVRERLFEACRLGKSAKTQHCAACKRPLYQGDIAYREAEPRDEPVSWRDVRVCGRCVDG